MKIEEKCKRIIKSSTIKYIIFKPQENVKKNVIWLVCTKRLEDMIHKLTIIL